MFVFLLLLWFALVRVFVEFWVWLVLGLLLLVNLFATFVIGGCLSDGCFAVFSCWFRLIVMGVVGLGLGFRGAIDWRFSVLLVA